jgi:hypothetical protein
MLVVAGLDGAVGDGDAVGVAGEIGEDSLRSGEGPLGVDGSRWNRLPSVCV